MVGERNLVIYQVGLACADVDAIDLSEFKRSLSLRSLAGSFGKYSKVTFVTDDLNTQSRLFQLVLVLRWLSKGGCWLTDANSVILVSASWLFKRALRYFSVVASVYPRVIWEVMRLAPLRKPAVGGAITKSDGNTVAYVRSDATSGHLMGGSVAHISGVVNSLGVLGYHPELFASMSIPLIVQSVPLHLVKIESHIYDHLELPSLLFSRRMEQEVALWLARHPASFIYQRYSLHSACGAVVAHRYKVPLVIEFNGSEVWINQHWGQGLRFPRLAAQVERTNLLCANLIVCVSQVDADMLLASGIEPGRILVNPNGVDVERFHPGVDGTRVKSELCLDDKFVFAFSGSFGPWHGVCELIEAFILMRSKHPASTTVLVLIGDGATRAEAESLVARKHASEFVVFTGSVSADRVPSYLAAADVLVAPHVANPDGSEFFGSPIKIFEYLAMGKPIIASDLGQMGDVLTHEVNAVLVSPGNKVELSQAMSRLMEDSVLLGQLGLAARRQGESHSWLKHTQRIVDALDRTLAPS